MKVTGDETDRKLKMQKRLKKKLGWGGLGRFLRKIASCWALVAHTLAETSDLCKFKDSLVYPVSSKIVRTLLQRNLVSKIFLKGEE